MIALILIQLVTLGVLIRMQVKQHENNKRTLHIMADINATLQEVNSKLEEASNEILALIEQLRSEALSDAGREALASIEAKANALADIVPNP